MKKLSRNSWIVLFVLLAFVMLSACALLRPLPKAKPGLYVNKDYRFTVSYPERWQPQKPMFASEVLRVAKPNEYKLPVLAVGVDDKNKGALLEYAPKTSLFYLMRAFPKSKRHKILSQEIIKLGNGTPATAFVFKWTWEDGMTKLVSSRVIAFKDYEIDGKKKSKAVSVTATKVLGGTPPEKLLEMCKSLKFY